ncbi:hypothetical protein GO495_11330 [Chitinophaga oryziterrae]|uniref:Uncharacterized protein n=1 Tax=Chitinophaga oryziterrae TaxID=1031224 RepID=A0A6N8JA35_9BACT|nr:hypothetical protein [Chitinophaga oryziterrae]MVT41176.1 hypothetical protein [Chitinophaga oryziterrae]
MDDKGQALTGMSVQIEGASKEAADDSFHIAVPYNDAVLVFVQMRTIRK